MQSMDPQFDSNSTSLSTRDNFLISPEGQSCNIEKLTVILKELQPLTRPYQDHQGNKIQLWKMGNQLVGSVLDASKKLILISQNKIFSPLSNASILKGLEKIPLRRWDIVFNTYQKALYLWPHLIASGRKFWPGDKDPEHITVQNSPYKNMTREQIVEQLKAQGYKNVAKTPGVDSYVHPVSKDNAFVHPKGQGISEKTPNKREEPNHVDFSRGGDKAKELRDKQAKLQGDKPSPKRYAYKDPTYRYHLSKDAEGPSAKQFYETLQKTRLVASYNLNHPDLPAPKGGGGGGKIGGVGCSLEPIIGLFDSAEAFFEEAHYFYLPQLIDGKAPFTDQELRQILRELAIGIYAHDTIPFFSLHFNENADQFPVIHPIYQHTLVGQVISMLDYMMKGYLNGGVFKEEFVQKWHENPNWKSQADQAIKDLIDFSKYCPEELEEEDADYVSLRLLMNQIMESNSSLEKIFSILENEIIQKCDQLAEDAEEKALLEKVREVRTEMHKSDPPIFSDFTQFSNSFRIIAHQKSVQKTDDIFALDPDFRVEYTINPSPAYLDALEIYQKRTGKFPSAYTLMELAYKIICRRIHDHMIKLPICRKYFSMLGVIHFFSCYLTTLKKHRKAPVLDPVEASIQAQSPVLFPHLPVARIQETTVKISMDEMTNQLLEQEGTLFEEHIESANHESKLIEAFTGILIDHVFDELSGILVGFSERSLYRYLRVNKEKTKTYRKLKSVAETYTHSLQERYRLFKEQFEEEVMLMGYLRLHEIPDSLKSDFQRFLKTKKLEEFNLTQEPLASHRQSLLRQAFQQIVDNILELKKKEGLFFHLDAPACIKKFKDKLSQISEVSGLIRILESKEFQIVFEDGGQIDPVFIECELKKIAQKDANNLLAVFESSYEDYKKNGGRKLLIEVFASTFESISFSFEIKEQFLSLSPELSPEEQVRGRRVVGGCGMHIDEYQIQPSKIAKQVQSNAWSSIQQLQKQEGLETWIPVSDKNDQSNSGVLFRLAFEDLSLWDSTDYAWMESSLLPSGPAEAVSHGMRRLSKAIKEDDLSEFVELMSHYPLEELKKMRGTEGRSLMHLAANQENIQFAQRLLDKGFPVNSKDEKGYLPIHYAAMKGNLTHIQLYLSKDRSLLNVQNYQGATSLIVAIQHGKLAVVQFLIKQKADCRLGLIDGYTPLHCALHHGYKEICQEILPHCSISTVNKATEDGTTPLMLAVNLKDVDLVKLLLNKKADANALRKDGWNALDSAIKNNTYSICELLLKNTKLSFLTIQNSIQRGSIEIFRLLVTKDGFFQITNELEDTALIVAVREGNVDAALYLINLCKTQPYIETENLLKETALRLAVDFGYETLIRALLDRGLQMPLQSLLEGLCRSGCVTILSDLLEDNSSTPLWNRLLQIAAESGQMAALAVVALKGGDLGKVQGPNGWTIEHYLAKFDGLVILRRRLSTQEDLLHRLEQEEGKTLAYVAAEWGSQKVLHFLLKEMFKRKTPLENHYGSRHLLYAIIERNDLKSLNLLFSHLSREEILSKSLDHIGSKAVHVASRSGSVKTLKFLNKQGADFAIADTLGYTPLDYAVRSEQKDVILFLLEKCKVSVTSKALGLAAVCNEHLVILPILHSFSPLVPPENVPESDTSIHKAACSTAKQVLRKLLKDKGPSSMDCAGNTPLFYAIEQGRIENVQLLLAYQADPNHRNYRQGTPLQYACEQGRLDIVRILVANGADVNLMGANQSFPLHMAIKRGFDHVSLYLIKEGADCEASDGSGYLPIHLAAMTGRTTVLRCLALKGVPVEIPSRTGLQPIHLAAITGKTKALATLQKAGVAIDTPTKIKENKKLQEERATPLLFAMGSGKTKAVKWLLEHHADPEAISKNGQGVLAFGAEANNQDLLNIFNPYRLFSSEKQLLPAIFKAIQQDSMNSLALLYHVGIPFNADVLEGLPGLHLACETSSLQSVHFFLTNEADLQIKDSMHRTAPEIAATNKSVEVLQLLLNYDPSFLNLPNDAGNTLLHQAARSGRLLNTMLLLDYGANKDARNAQGFTPLHLAVQAGQTNVVRLLLGMGANASSKSIFKEKRPVDLVNPEDIETLKVLEHYETICSTSNFGSSLIHHAVRARIKEAVILLKDLVNYEDGKKFTPLHLAVMENDLSMVVELLRQGANLNAKTINGYTPFWFARKHSNPSEEIIRLLGNAGGEPLPEEQKVLLEIKK